MSDQPATTEPAPEPAAPEPAPAAPDAFGTQTEPAPETSPPDVSEALSQFTQRLESIEGKLTAPAEEPPDAWEALTAPSEPEEPVYEPAPEQAQQPTPDDQLVSEFNALVDQRVNEIVQPHFQQQELGRRKEAIDGLAARYPDFTEVIPVIGPKMEQLAQRYGNPEMATDPELAESLYMAHKAAAVAAAETPAEAQGQGASLETGAGPGNGDTEPSFQEKYLGQIMATVPQPGSVFD